LFLMDLEQTVSLVHSNFCSQHGGGSKPKRIFG